MTTVQIRDRGCTRVAPHEEGLDRLQINIVTEIKYQSPKQNCSRRHFEIYFFCFSQKTGYEMSNPVFWEKEEKSICRLLKMPREW